MIIHSTASRSDSGGPHLPPVLSPWAWPEPLSLFDLSGLSGTWPYLGVQPSFAVWSGTKNRIGSYHVDDCTRSFPGAIAPAVPLGTSPITPDGQRLLST